MLRGARGPSLATASGLINGAQGRVMSGISRADLTDASGGGEYAPAFSTSVKLGASNRPSCWCFWPGGGGGAEVSPVMGRTAKWNLCVRTCLCFKS